MPLDDHDRLALAVAYLTSLDKKQTAICAELGIRSQTEVSRLLRHAENKGWITRVFQFPDELSEDEREAVRCRGFPEREKLKRQLGQLASKRNGALVKSLQIVHLDHREPQPYADFGRLVARHVAELIASAKICAVAWGQTVMGVIDAIEDVPEKRGLDLRPGRRRATKLQPRLFELHQQFFIVYICGAETCKKIWLRLITLVVVGRASARSEGPRAPHRRSERILRLFRCVPPYFCGTGRSNEQTRRHSHECR
jgi:hypothetical protein